MSIPLFDFAEREVSVTKFRNRPRSVYEDVDVPGHVVFVTKRGKRQCAIMSIETYAILTGRYEETMDKIETLCRAAVSEKKGKTNEKVHRI